MASSGLAARSGKLGYNHTVSISYTPNGTQYYSGVYGSGDSYRGYYSTDTFSIGGIRLNQLTFAEVNTVSDPSRVYLGQPYDGILGLGWPALSDGGTVPLTALLTELPEPIFSFYLGNNSAGLLVLGGIDHSHYQGSLTYVPLSATTFWQIDVQQVRVGSTVISSSVQTTIVDTGTPQLCGPPAAVNRIVALWSAQPIGNGTYAVNCNTSAHLPSIVFTLSSLECELAAQDLIVDWKADGLCELGLVAQDPSPDWAFGDTFMRKFLTVFDAGNKRLGFAKAVTPML